MIHAIRLNKADIFLSVLKDNEPPVRLGLNKADIFLSVLKDNEPPVRLGLNKADIFFAQKVLILI